MGRVKITLRNLQKRICLTPSQVKKTILKVLSSEGIRKSGEIAVCLVDDRHIKGFNKRFLGKSYPTDVLAFDISGEKDKFFSDIIISVDTAVSNSKYFNTNPEYELRLYLVHGVLHLSGYEDNTKSKKKFMEEKAARILAALGVEPNGHT